jgi:hypothetical protein
MDVVGITPNERQFIDPFSTMQQDGVEIEILLFRC